MHRAEYVPMWRDIFDVLSVCLFSYLSFFDYFVLCRCVCYHIYVVQEMLIIILHNYFVIVQCSHKLFDYIVITCVYSDMFGHNGCVIML